MSVFVAWILFCVFFLHSFTPSGEYLWRYMCVSFSSHFSCSSGGEICFLFVLCLCSGRQWAGIPTSGDSPTLLGDHHHHHSPSSSPWSTTPSPVQRERRSDGNSKSPSDLLSGLSSVEYSHTPGQGGQGLTAVLHECPPSLQT